MRKGDAMAEKIKLRDGQELPIFPLGEGRLEALLLIKAFAKKICFRGDGDFADGRRMLETPVLRSRAHTRLSRPPSMIAWAVTAADERKGNLRSSGSKTHFVAPFFQLIQRT